MMMPRNLVVGDNNGNPTRGLYPNDAFASDNGTLFSTTPNTEPSDSPSSGGSRSALSGIKPNTNLSALSLALLSMNTDTDSSSPDPSETDAAAVTTTTATTDLGPSGIRRAALHSAPPSAATGVGEYGYAYNNNNNNNSHNHHQNQQNSPNTPITNNQKHQENPSVSSSPASAVNPLLFRGPSTPLSSTFGTTPPGYLLGATPSMGSHGTTNPGTMPSGGILMPPARPPSAGTAAAGVGGGVAPPFERPLGFAGQASATSNTHQTPLQSHQQQQQSTPTQLGGAELTPEEQKPSLDLLHSSPFHHSTMGSHHHHHYSSNHQSPPQKDRLSSFLQAEENASIEAATTFINDFYHHHYPMASADDHHHMAYNNGEDYHRHHSSALFAETTSSFFETPDGLLQAEDMPFAVEGFSSGTTPTGLQATSVMKHSTGHEASLMAASMMAPHKKLALFGSTTTADGHKNSETKGTCRADADDDMSALTDQLADFRSFGASLTSPLTTSVGSVG